MGADEGGAVVAAAAAARDNEGSVSLVVEEEFLCFRRRAVTGAGPGVCASPLSSSVSSLPGVGAGPVRRKITGVEWVLGLAG